MSEAEKEEKKEEQAHLQAMISADVVFKTIRHEGEEELDRASAGLAFSGLAAGLSMGFSFVTQAALHAHLPPAEWTPLISTLGYAVGFVIVILGRQQLFTENTLTPIIPLLDRASHIRIRDVARLWVVVLVANLVGAAAFAFAIANLGFFDGELRQAFHDIGTKAVDRTFGELLGGGLFAGYLVALMAWLRPAAEYSRLAVIVMLAYVIGIAGFPHIIAGSVDVFYLVATDALSFGSYFVDWMLPTLLGNAAGGVMLVAALNYAQVAASRPGPHAA